MGWTEIKYEQGGGPKFFVFEMIGSVFNGIFDSSSTAKNTFNKDETRFTFRTKEGLQTLPSGYDLEKKLTSAELQKGDRVRATYLGEVPIEGRDKPMKQYKVEVMRAADAAALSAASKAQAAAPKPPAPPPPPKPAAAPAGHDEFDDIPL